MILKALSVCLLIGLAMASQKTSGLSLKQRLQRLSLAKPTTQQANQNTWIDFKCLLEDGTEWCSSCSLRTGYISVFC